MKWKNRIVKTSIENPESLIPNDLNWREHPDFQRKSINSILDQVGWVQNVIVNANTGNIIDGHLRVEEALRTEQSVPVVYVDLTEDEEKLILATFDPISTLADTNKDILINLINEISTDNDQINDLLVSIMMEKDDVADFIKPEENKNNYTRKIESPIYSPSDTNPEIAELYDNLKTNKLKEKIKNSNISDEEKKFLEIAADRHTIFNFSKIADYYSCADIEMQQLMEESALVIIDFNKAIENGFVEMNNEMMGYIEEKDEYDE